MIRTLFKYLFILTCIFYAGPASAATFYVATTGSDFNSCASAKNINTTKRNLMGLNGGIACLQTPGDKLLVRGGTYSEEITNRNGQNFPSGTSWADAFTVAVYPGETVLLTKGLGFGDCCGNAPLPQMSYWIFDGFRMTTDTDSSGLIYNGFHADHIRFINMDLTNNYATNANPIGDWSILGGNATGMCLSGGGDHMEFINMEIHDCGAYGTYFTGHDSLFDHLKVHDVYQLGLHLYHYGSQDVYNNTVRNSEVYNVRPTLRNGGTNYGNGILLASGYNNQAYNNIVRNSGNGIAAAYGSTGFKIYNNTIYNNSQEGISVSYLNVGGATIKNNIVYNNVGGNIIDWTGVNPAMSNNLCGSLGAGCSIVANPNFVNSGANDVHLQSSSPAINQGATLSEVTVDFDGITRPQGSAYDIGAYEYVSATTSLSGDLNGDRIVNSLDWSLMSAKWLTNDASADLNKDGIVNSLDWSIMSGNWLKTG